MIDLYERKKTRHTYVWQFRFDIRKKSILQDVHFVTVVSNKGKAWAYQQAYEEVRKLGIWGVMAHYEDPKKWSQVFDDILDIRDTGIQLAYGYPKRTKTREEVKV